MEYGWNNKLDEFNLAVVRRMIHQFLPEVEVLLIFISLRPKFHQRFVKTA